MEARYLLVRGVPDLPVANPHVDPTTKRCLGKMPNGIFWKEGPLDPETNEPRWPAAEPVEEVVKEDGEGYLKKMIAKGCIVLVDKCVAASHEHARAQFDARRPKPANKTKAPDALAEK